MNVDEVITAMNREGCQFLLIGGMNFMLRHQPILTYDIDFWIEDSVENRRRCERSLSALDAEWGRLEETWGPVKKLPGGWLDVQHVFCLTTPHGAVDIFRSVAGLDDWQECRLRAVHEATSSGIEYFGLSDEDMLRCQLALAEPERKADRIRALEIAIQQQEQSDGH